MCECEYDGCDNEATHHVTMKTKGLLTGEVTTQQKGELCEEHTANAHEIAEESDVSFAEVTPA